MGRKKKKKLHPADEFRKKQRKRELKKNKNIRKELRAEQLKRKPAAQIKEDIAKIKRLEKMGVAEEKQLQRKNILLKAYEQAVKREIEEKRLKEKQREMPTVIKGLGKIIPQVEERERLRRQEQEEAERKRKERMFNASQHEEVFASHGSMEVSTDAPSSGGPADATATPATAATEAAEPEEEEDDDAPALPPGIAPPPGMGIGRGPPATAPPGVMPFRGPPPPPPRNGVPFRGPPPPPGRGMMGMPMGGMMPHMAMQGGMMPRMAPPMAQRGMMNMPRQAPPLPPASASQAPVSSTSTQASGSSAVPSSGSAQISASEQPFIHPSRRAQVSNGTSPGSRPMTAPTNPPMRPPMHGAPPQRWMRGPPPPPPSRGRHFRPQRSSMEVDPMDPNPHTAHLHMSRYRGAPPPPPRAPQRPMAPSYPMQRGPPPSGLARQLARPAAPPRPTVKVDKSLMPTHLVARTRNRALTPQEMRKRAAAMRAKRRGAVVPKSSGIAAVPKPNAAPDVGSPPKRSAKPPGDAYAAFMNDLEKLGALE